jgi:aryl-alcohol dehydrogenase-like predicted oxidoreductase
MATTTITFGNREIPRIGLGTNRLTNTPANIAFVKAATEAGIGMIDTAHLYTGGDSERTLGEAIDTEHADCVVATKGGFDQGDRETLHAQITQSLSSLNTGRIELYYLHRTHHEVPIETSVAAIKEFQDDGKVAHIGLSQVDVEQIERARQVAPIAAVQNHYNISERKYDEVIDYCAANGILFVPYFPLKGDLGSEVPEIAKHHNVTASQVVLAWLLARSPAVLPIPGTLSLDHLRENVGALTLELSTAEVDAIRQAPART